MGTVRTEMVTRIVPWDNLFKRSRANAEKKDEPPDLILEGRYRSQDETIKFALHMKPSENSQREIRS